MNIIVSLHNLESFYKIGSYSSLVLNISISRRTSTVRCHAMGGLWHLHPSGSWRGLVVQRPDQIVAFLSFLGVVSKRSEYSYLISVNLMGSRASAVRPRPAVACPLGDAMHRRRIAWLQQLEERRRDALMRALNERLMCWSAHRDTDKMTKESDVHSTAVHHICSSPQSCG